MKIAFIGVKGIPYGGGIEKVTEEIGSRLVARGHEVIVYCDKAYCQDEGYYKGMKLKPLASIKHPSCQKVSNSLIAAAHLCVNRNVDMVHLHSIASLFAPIIKLFSISIVVHVHSFEWRKDKWNLFVRFFLRLSDYFTAWFADQIVVVSGNLHAYFNTRSKGKVCLLRNGASRTNYASPDLIRRYGLSIDNYILYIGRLSREKGVEYLIEAYSQIDTRKMLVLAGGFTDQGFYRRCILKKIRNHGRIRQLGYVEGKLKAELLSNAYLTVFPSEIEGSPLALSEAISYGNCCVVSDIQEHLDILNGNGFTFRNGDASCLTRVLASLLNQRILVNECKRKAKRHSLKKHDWSNIVDSYEAMYSSLLDTRRRRYMMPQSSPKAEV
jgi:glycosyltransferase involved in cell wall biosynthesis